MGVFIAASDETSGADHRSRFMNCGFLAPEEEWSLFSEKWDAKVLAGPPRIPYLHMTEIRSSKWREENSLTDCEAQRRVEAAFSLISETPALTPVAAGLDAGHLLDTFTKKVELTSGARRPFAPDYLAFISYAFAVLMFCHHNKPNAEKVNFVVERKGETTNRIQEFYAGLPISLEYIGQSRLIPMLGDLLAAGKDHVPLQAADLLCWHTRRSKEGTLDSDGIRRFAVVANRMGQNINIENNYITELWSEVNKEDAPNGKGQRHGTAELQSDDGDDSSCRF